MRNNDVNVEFHVLVPKGVKVGVNTINGAVTVEGATAEVDAATVNGDVEVATSGGPVNATTVNGGVRARVGRVDSDADMDFTTVNGTVIAEFTGEFGGDVEMSTVNCAPTTRSRSLAGSTPSICAPISANPADRGSGSRR
jgi:DUF4097 and DUF4098 domain-containing protein YvlB